MKPFPRRLQQSENFRDGMRMTIDLDIEPGTHLSGQGTDLAVELKEKKDRERVLMDKDFLEVCKEILIFTIESQVSLDIICRPWVPENAISEIQKPPSWLVTTENTAFGARPDRNYGRKNADTLVGVPGLSNRDYSASKETKVTPVAYRPDRPTTGWCFGTGAKAHSTYVEGFVIDLVSTKKPYAADGIIVNEWLAAGDWADDSILPPDQFWRTLVAHRGPNGLNPPTYHQRACKTARNQSVKGGHISTSALVHYGNSTIVANFARRVQEAVWMRRLIKTQRGMLGLGPEKTKKRDLICILYGCTVPVLFRKDNPDEPDEYFHVVGECYVHGLMDGEAFAMKQNEKNNKSALTVDPVSVDMRGINIIPDLQRPLASFTRRNNTAIIPLEPDQTNQLAVRK